jgi:hypothetical protein
MDIWHNRHVTSTCIMDDGMKMDGSFNVPVSLFINCKSKAPFTTITLAEWITMCTNPSKSPLLALTIKHLRTYKEKDAILDLKQHLPAISPGALLRTRSQGVSMEEKLIGLTGFMQFDIDSADNPWMNDAAVFRDWIRTNKYIAFCSLSASGRGVWGLVKLAHPERMIQHYAQLKRDFLDNGIVIDPRKGGNPTDLRYYSFDPDAYIANSYEIYERIFIQSDPEYSGDHPQSIKARTRLKVEQMVAEIVKSGLDIAYTYDSYVRVGFAFSIEFGESGRALFHAVCSPCPKYNHKHADYQYSACLKNNNGSITIATFFHLRRQAVWNIEKPNPLARDEEVISM